MKLHSLIVATLVAASGLARAETPTPLDPMVVTVTRDAAHVSQLAANVLVISRDEIERSQALDLADLLQFYAGFEVERSGGPGQLAFVRIRGGESDHTLILIDGVRINPATGAPTLEHLSPDMIDHIEIVKGPRSTLYGSDAMAGVINIITRKATTSGVDMKLSSGAHNTGTAAADLRYADPGKRISANVEQSHSDGIPVCADGGPARGFARTSAKLEGALTGHDIVLSGRVFDTHGHTEYVDFCGPFGNNPLDQEFVQQTLAVNLSARPAPAWALDATVSRMLDDIDQRQSSDYIRTQRPQLEIRNRIDIGQHSASFTASAAHENVRVLSFGTPIAEDRKLYALRLQYGWTGDTQHVLLASSWDDHDTFGSKVTWNADYGTGVWDGGELLLSAGSGFRAPNVFERFTGYGGNPDLKPETARNFELGLRQRLADTQVIDLRLFRTDTDDLIAYINGQNQNVRRYRNQGVDLSYRLELDAWSLMLTGLVQHPENRDTGEDLQRRARRSAGLRLLRRLGPHSVGLDIAASSRRPDTDFSSFPATPVFDGGYGIVDLDGSLRLSPQWRLQARVHNLLDKTYQTAYGYRQEGAAAYVTLTFTN